MTSSSLPSNGSGISLGSEEAIGRANECLTLLIGREFGGTGSGSVEKEAILSTGMTGGVKD